MGHLAQAVVASIVTQPKATMGSSHVVGKWLDFWACFSGFMDVVAHDAIAIEDQSRFMGLFKIVFLDGSQIAAFFVVGLHEEFTVVSAPDFVKDRVGAEYVFSRDPHT